MSGFQGSRRGRAAADHRPSPAENIQVCVLALVCAAVLGWLPAGSAAGAPLDSDAHWWDGFDANGLDNRAAALAVHDGGIVAGGWFTSAGRLAADNIARWTDGWSAVGEGLNAAVYALLSQPGRLVAGGEFGAAGHVSASHIAAWNGSAWSPFGAGVNGPVYALASLGEALVAAGAFTQAGTVPVEHIAWWNGAQWEGFGSGGMNTSVYCLAAYQGCLVAGGDFSQAGGVACANVAALCDGENWSPLGSGMNRGVWALTVYEGDLIAGGSFSVAGGAPANFIARWDGAAWHPLGSGTDGVVSALTVYDGHLVAAGGFSTAGGVPCSNIARWDGLAWHPLGSGTDGAVSALAAQRDSLYVAGGFNQAGGKPSSRIALWSGSLTAVSLASFTGERDGLGVTLRWSIADALDHLGFHVYRSEAGGPREKLTTDLLTGAPEYRFTDARAPASSLEYWLQEVGRSGELRWHGPVRVARGESAPAFTVGPGRPNPFDLRATCAYDLPSTAAVRVTVHDARGRRLRILVDGIRQAGRHEVEWDGRNAVGTEAAAGVYFVRVEWNGESRSARVVLAR